ncbi:phosphotransferase [Actinopolymorpha rutila]|uniref:Thiamine kinase n=1 Tax=Actinopolymorpha rutila TaxID=446787 RepID=A0A852ZKC0_9ACTN|nr:phosphotransferase [Actinopolymorpha rutila]NYH93434.1 hypothetical protein [Actinopolymorpha rutila]
MAELTTTYVREVLLREVGGPDWQISEPLGTGSKTRLVHRGSTALAVKLVDTPPRITARLSEIGVTPPIVAVGEYDKRRYTIQQAVTGPHPDRDWFAGNLPRWADLVRSYLDDDELHRLLAETPAFWRLDVTGAVAVIDRSPAPTMPVLQEPGFRASLERWREQAEAVVRLPHQPIHPDAHVHNYVIAGGRPYLLDWEYVDLSDPLRDVGFQVCGSLHRGRWAEFLRRIGHAPSEELEIAMLWWAAFKMAMNAFFNDGRGDERGAAFHAHYFRMAVDRRSWVDQR